MGQQLRMPKLGLTMTEGSVVEWPVAEGQRFAAGEVYAVVETDKVANDLQAPSGGTMKRILVPAGETVPVGTVIAEWESDGEPALDRAAAHTEGASPAERPARITPSAVALTAARRLTQAKQEIPHFYLGTEIDTGALRELRAKWNSDPSRPRLTVTHLFLAAAARTLAAHRDLNRIWDDGSYVELPKVDIGLAVHTERGLLVPVLRDAGGASLADISRRTSELVARARDDKLAPGDAGGGAMTLSNAGMYDVTRMGSIINPGQAAILGVGTEREVFRPDENKMPRLAREIAVVLSCDHRVLDAAGGVRLLNGIRALLESPEKLLD